MKQYYFLILGVLLATNIFAQNEKMEVTKYSSKQEILDVIKNVLLAPLNDKGEVSNVTYKGSKESFGTYKKGGAIGIDEGVCLSTGKVVDLVGPNNHPSVSSIMNTSGDAHLDQILDDEDLVYVTRDAVKIEFDFKANYNEVKFNLVYGSEEYSEWITQNRLNDIFGIFVSGSGIEDEVLGSQNIAVVPFTEDRQMINVHTVNCGFVINPNEEPPGNPDANCEYYVHNNKYNDVTYPQLDGFTHPIMCKVQTTIGETYHFKIVIADTFNKDIDSGLFLTVDYDAENDETLRVVEEKSIDVDGELKIFPNPTNSNLNVSLSQAVDANDIIIVDMMGRVLITKEISGQHSININTDHLNPGIYNVVVRGDNGINYSQKLQIIY
ncbi:MAG: choice-of-anchor L domain-containing protein [Hyphomicrobiales bacterium]